MGKGKLIVLEGGDSAGKSTQVKQITKYFDDNNITYACEHFPKYGHNEFSEVIAKFLRGEFGTVDEVDPYFVANIYAMDRYLYLPELLQKLEDNDVVLLDRYVVSNVAFQGAKFRNEEESAKIQSWIEDFEFEFLDLPYPDLTLYMDVPSEVAEERLKDREGDDREYLKGKQDIHEADMEFQKRVRAVYQSYSSANNYHIIRSTVVNEDAGETSLRILTPEEIFESYKKLL